MEVSDTGRLLDAVLISLFLKGLEHDAVEIQLEHKRKG